MDLQNQMTMIVHCKYHFRFMPTRIVGYKISDQKVNEFKDELYQALLFGLHIIS